MERSVYSLVLSDDVIQKIDRMAYAMNTSRSNLINQILADYVSYTTPEKRMKDIFDSLCTMIRREEPFLIQNQGSDALLNIRSSLQVKYNPTIKYTVELFRNQENNVGELRIMTRTQSEELLDQLADFFLLFSTIERAYSSIPPQYQIGRGRFVRKFILADPNMNSDEIGAAIARFIQCVDQALKAYLNAEPRRQRTAVEEIYRCYRRTDPLGL